MIKITEVRDAKTISMTIDNANATIMDLEELFTNFVNAIGIRGFIVEINPEFLNSGMDISFEPEPPEEGL